MPSACLPLVVVSVQVTNRKLCLLPVSPLVNVIVIVTNRNLHLLPASLLVSKFVCRPIGTAHNLPPYWLLLINDRSGQLLCDALAAFLLADNADPDD